MTSRWRDIATATPVLCTACSRDDHRACQTPHCACLCKEPGGVNYGR